MFVTFIALYFLRWSKRLQFFPTNFVLAESILFQHLQSTIYAAAGPTLSKDEFSNSQPFQHGNSTNTCVCARVSVCVCLKRGLTFDCLVTITGEWFVMPLSSIRFFFLFSLLETARRYWSASIFPRCVMFLPVWWCMKGEGGSGAFQGTLGFCFIIIQTLR